MVDANPNQQYALVEITDRISFGPPEDLESLVLLEELSPIELLNTAKQELRWRLSATLGLKRTVAFRVVDCHGIYLIEFDAASESRFSWLIPTHRLFG